MDRGLATWRLKTGRCNLPMAPHLSRPPTPAGYLIAGSWFREHPPPRRVSSYGRNFRGPTGFIGGSFARRHHSPTTTHGAWDMEPIFAAAIGHVRLMESRIAQQEAELLRLREAGQDPSEARKRLCLLRTTLGEMRIQLARLVPTEEQIAPPTWVLAKSASAGRTA